MQKKVLSILLVFLFANISYAGLLSKKECSSSDVASKNLAAKELLSSPRDQDSIGWCYGFSGADLISIKLGKSVSAAHLSAMYNKASYKGRAREYNFLFKNPVGRLFGHMISKLQGTSLRELESVYKNNKFKDVIIGGKTNKSLRVGKKYGQICLEKDYPFDYLYSNQFLEFIQVLELMKNSEDWDRDLSKSFFCNFSYPYADKYVKNWDSFEQLYEALKSKNMNDFLAESIQRACKGRMVAVPQLKIKKIRKPILRFKRSKRAYLKKINKQLDLMNPLEISYRTKLVTPPKSGVDGMHSSVVTAKEWRNGKCHYKVRNSWGRSCSAYKSSIDCNREEGSFWVDDETFFNMSKSLTYIK